MHPEIKTIIMTREDLTPEAYQKLIKTILDFLVQNGIKATTMDSIAAHTRMSKRTLYEIFGSKNDMVREALDTMKAHHEELQIKSFNESDNIIEGLLKCMRLHRDLMRHISVSFLIEIDEIVNQDESETQYNKNMSIDRMVEMFRMCASKGFFRRDVNYPVAMRMFWIQMESLKRMEQHFPPDITLVEAYDNIIQSLMRSIVNPRKLDMFEKIYAEVYLAHSEEDNNTPQ